MMDPSRLLLVEDHADVREALAEFLSSEGFTVVGCESAEEGLTALEAADYDALVTDYALPGEDGAWLVAAAREKGRLPRTVAMVTAVPRDVEVEGVPVLRKPLDLGELLGVLRHEGVAPRHRVDLILYVAGGTDASRRARENLERALACYRPEDVRWTVCDLAGALPPEALADRISRTPTLVKRTPAPPAWITGDLTDAKPLHDLLETAGARRHRGR
jgi:CheY-like chemotaxis protein